MLPAALLSLALMGSSPAQDTLKPVQVMTFNIRYGTANDGENRWELRRDLLFQVIRDQKPDVIGFQEALRPQVDELRAALVDFDWIGVGRDDGKDAGEFAPIFYRRKRFKPLEFGTFWFSKTPEVVASKSWGNNVTRICTWAQFQDTQANSETFYVFNVHLDHESAESRKQSVKLLMEKVLTRKSKDPNIVLGDFNEGEEDPAVLDMKGKVKRRNEFPPDTLWWPYWVDTFRERNADVKDVSTFHNFQGSSKGEKIDYIFVSPDWEVQDAKIIRTHRDSRWPSDHFPVTAKIAMNAF